MHRLAPYSQHFTEEVNEFLSAPLTGVAGQGTCGWAKYYHDRQTPCKMDTYNDRKFSVALGARIRLSVSVFTMNKQHLHRKSAHPCHHLSAATPAQPAARVPDTTSTHQSQSPHIPPRISPAAQQAEAVAEIWDTSTSSTLRTRPFKADDKIFGRWIVPPRTQW
jgi:hypothetical protein